MDSPTKTVMTEHLTTRIVVGVDFEDTGDFALVTAMRLARRLPGCELHPVHVLPHAPGKEKLDQLDAAIEKAGEVLMERVRYAAHYLFGVEEWEQSTVLHVRVGEPAPSIHQVAIDMDGDMIVVGHRHQGLVDRLVLGSVAETLLRKSKVPVMIARPKELEGEHKSDWPEAKREGEDVHGGRGWTRSELVRFGPRTSHISGML